MTLMEPTMNTITLSDGYMRDLLVTGLCQRLDIVEYFRTSERMKLDLRHVKGDEFLCNCPFCQAADFWLDRKTGWTCCHRCNRENDFLSMIEEEHGYDLEEVLAYLTGYLQCKNAQRIRLLKGGVA